MDFKLPQIGEGVYEAELVRWLVAVGDTVRRGQGLLEVLTDKATMEVPAPFAGTVTALRAEPGQALKVGDLLLSYKPLGVNEPEPELAAAPVSAPVPVADSPPAPVVAKTNGPIAAPSVRHLARKLGIDLKQVRGTGPAGRILLDDVTALVQSSKRSKPAPGPSGLLSLLDVGKAGTRIKFQGIRRRIAEHMVAATDSIPHYSYVDECEVTELVRLRESIRGPTAERGVKLTYLAFFVKAAALALRDVPIVNSSLDLDNGDIVLHAQRHIGIAVATRAGLVVPVVRDADRKDLFTIARDIDRLTNEARAGRPRLDDLRGSTFTVTSIGGIGGLIATPIINHPEAAILGLGKVVKRPVYDDLGNLRPADLIYLSFTFDHRIIDGAVGATFGNALIDYLKNPAVLLLPEG